MSSDPLNHNIVTKGEVNTYVKVSLWFYPHVCFAAQTSLLNYVFWILLSFVSYKLCFRSLYSFLFTSICQIIVTILFATCVIAIWWSCRQPDIKPVLKYKNSHILALHGTKSNEIDWLWKFPFKLYEFIRGSHLTMGFKVELSHE